jgi:hypothetical protein
MATTKESKVPEENTFTRVCECKNCGNEAEMVVTCSLAAAPPVAGQQETAPRKGRKGTAHCSHCGSEADIWLEDA